MAAEQLHLLRQFRREDELQVQCFTGVLHTGVAEPGVASHQADADVRGQPLHRLAQELRRPVDAGGVA
jgi:hypothetical protein